MAQILAGRAGLLLLEVGARHVVLELAHGRAGEAARHQRVGVGCLDDRLLVVDVDRALFRDEQARAHLHATRSERKRRDELVAACDAARRDDGDIGSNAGNDLRHEGHRGHLANVTSALCSLGDHAVDTGLEHALRERGGGDYREYEAAGVLPRLDVLGRIARTRRDERDALGDD